MIITTTPQSATTNEVTDSTTAGVINQWNLEGTDM